MLAPNLRGGMSFASQRYAESAVFADMNHLPRQIDEKGRHSVILDIDANNLYGCSQTFPLPYKDFKFLSKEEFLEIDWRKINLDGEIGFFVEVTLDYPSQIWGKTQSFPLCPQNFEITYDILSPYQKRVLKEIYNKNSYKSTKLTATFLRREKITLHAKNLQLFLNLGMELVQVHQVVSFAQGPFMKVWVDFCTKKRSKAKTDFEKNFFKLLVNSVFGKTIESVSNRKKVKICLNIESFSKWTRDPNYERHVIINDDVSIVILKQTKARVIQPFYIGFSILELSKHVMYDFFYNVLRPYFGEDGVQLLYSDTDSLAIQVQTFNILLDLGELAPNMDFSNLAKSHPLFCESNRAALFKFKEEFALQPIARLCALKSKCYSFEIACACKTGLDERAVCIKCKNGTSKSFHTNKLKGIQKRTAREIHFSKYLKCLENSYVQRDMITQITSKTHQLTTNIVNKISLSSFDDKRFIFNCGVHSSPFSSKTTAQCPFCKY